MTIERSSSSISRHGGESVKCAFPAFLPSRIICFTGLLLTGLFLAGCDWVNVARFRREVRTNPPSYTLDDTGQFVILRFTTPVLPEKTLSTIGIPLEKGPDNVSKARYKIRVADFPDESFELIFRFREAKLEAIQLPALLPELFGEKNIQAFFRLAGGARLSADAFADVPPEQLEAMLNEHYHATADLGLTLEIHLRHELREDKDIMIRLARPDMDSPFREVALRM
jgi:hypothetical protein